LANNKKKKKNEENKIWMGNIREKTGKKKGRQKRINEGSKKRTYRRMQQPTSLL
jgi:hypothetical protein